MAVNPCQLQHLRPCDGTAEAHHVVPQQRIKKRGWEFGFELADALGDRRNHVLLCRRHHHRITHGFDRDHLAAVIMQQLTDLRAFAADWGLTPALDHELRLYGLLGGDVPPGDVVP